MLKRDILTRNIQVLVQMLARLTGLSLDNPNDALDEINRTIEDDILDKLEKKSGEILLIDDQLVKVHIDLAYLRAQILYSKDGNTIELEKVKKLLLNYQEIFPKNFPFDYYGKMSKLDQQLKNN
jgi:hypothetical protein